MRRPHDLGAHGREMQRKEQQEERAPPMTSSGMRIDGSIADPAEA